MAERRRQHQADVEKYLAEVLAAVPLPKDFPRAADVVVDADNEHAVVRFWLPGTDTIPTVREAVYVKSKDGFRETVRPVRDCQHLYQSLISQVSLLVIRDLFEADDELNKISFNGHVDRTDPATGQPASPAPRSPAG